MLKQFAWISFIVLTLTMPAHAVEISQPAPDFSAIDIEGKSQSVSQYKGKIVVLEWHNPGCPFVVKHYESKNMQTLQAEAAGNGVVWLTINSSAKDREGAMDPEEAKKKMSEDEAKSSAYILDPEGKIGKLYGAKTTPHMFVIDKEGNVAYAGAIDDKATADVGDVKGARNFVRKALEELAEGKAVSTTQVRAYGCSVKYAK